MSKILLDSECQQHQSAFLLLLDPNLDFSYIIVGAGAAGLWLADGLLQSGLLDDNTLCIIEADGQKTNDRTWCYWSQTSFGPSEMVSKTWEQSLNPGQLDRITDLTPYNYYHVRSEDFYTILKKRLSAHPHVSFKTDTVVSVHQKDETATVQNETRVWKCNYVFTSVDFLINAGTQQKKSDRLFLLQSFFGWRIKTELPAFDPTNLTLMRFDIDQSDNTQFIYVLPYSSNEALVEVTRFGETHLPQSIAEHLLQNFLATQQIQYQVLETESGAIPMTPDLDVSHGFHDLQKRVIPIGTIAGAIKPSTGYGFKRMQAHGVAVAQALKANTALPTLRRKWRFRMYDIILLRILKHRPDQGSIIFTRLFKTQPMQRVFRFLDEKTSLWEEVQIFVKLPIPIFLRSLINKLG